MPSRPVGRLLDLEYEILRASLSLEGADEPVYGFALARAMSSAPSTSGLIGHGTLYKALSRLSKLGLLESEWERDGETDAGRPRRRLYKVTGEGVKAFISQPSRDTASVSARTALA